MIEFENVTKVYDDGTVAIEDVSFRVEGGTTTVLVGPSGCGKTTTMKLVNRLEDPTEGTVYYDGAPVTEMDPIELRRNVGYVIQEIGLFDHMTVEGNIGTVPELMDWDEDRIHDRVTELLELMDMPPEDFRDQYPRELSGGQRQRVGVARALAADPDVLLMDEPFGALDPITRENLQDEFLEIQEEINKTILFVTHDIDEALKMGDRIALFEIGSLVQYAPPRELLENPKNRFVEDFIGEHRALKKLQVTPVKEVMEERDPEDLSEDLKAIARGEIDGVEPLTLTDSTQVALSQLIGNNLEVIPVVDNGDIIGVVTEPGIRGREAYEMEGD